MGMEDRGAIRSTRRQRSFRVEAIVLRHQDYGEADRLLVLLTQEKGKLHAIAKGVRKPASRKAGHLEPFTCVSLQLARGRDLMIVTQAETVEAYLPLREDLLLASYASYVVELLDRFTYQEGEADQLYRLLKRTLARLCSTADAVKVVRYYEIRLLDLLGFRPQLFTCVHCKEEIQPQDQYFSDELGGVLCPQCKYVAPDVHPISMPALKFLRHFQRSNYKDAMRAKISPRTAREMELLMQRYLTYHLERGLNTPAFIKRVKRTQA